MSIDKRVRSIRMSDADSSMFDRIQAAFDPFVHTFSETVLLCGRLVWYMLTTPGILSDVVAVCQRLQRTTSYTPDEKMAQQLAFSFPPADGYALRVDFYGKGTPVEQRPLDPIKAVGAALETAAWDASLSGKFRQLFAQVSTRRAA